MSQARIWQRFTFAERLSRFAVFLGFTVALSVSLRTVEIIPEFLLDAPTQIADLLKRMWPLDIAYYPDGIHHAMMETLHIASLGTLLCIILAVPVGILGAKNIVRQPLLNWLAKLILVSSRSVNTLVWALLFVAVFGPGNQPPLLLEALVERRARQRREQTDHGNLDAGAGASAV